jgi:hypothetical protein
MAEPIEIADIPEPQAPMMDWGNDQLFFTHDWWDETSQFDDHPSTRWCGGLECYERQFKARIPIAFKDCDEAIEWFIIWMQENHEIEQGFWVG